MLILRQKSFLFYTPHLKTPQPVLPYWKGRFDMTPWFHKLVSKINFGFNFPPQGVPIWRSITTPRQRSQPKNLVSYMRKHFKSLHKVWDTWFQIRRICWRKNVLQMTQFSQMMVSELITCFHESWNYEFCFRGFRELTFLIRISEFIRCFHQFVSRIFLRWPVEKETIINIPRFGIEDWWNYLMNSLNNSYIGNFHLLYTLGLIYILRTDKKNSILCGEKLVFLESGFVKASEEFFRW